MSSRPARLTLNAKVTTVMTLLVGVMCLFMYAYLPARIERHARVALAARAATVASMIGKSVSAAVLFDDRRAATDYLRAARVDPDVCYAVVEDRDGRVFASHAIEEAERNGYRGPAGPGDAVTLRTTAPVEEAGERIGTVYLGMSFAHTAGEVDAARRTVALLTAAIFGAGLAASFLLSSILTNPIRRMVRTVDRVAEGDLGTRAAVMSRDEVGRLALAFNRLLDRLDASRRELQDTNANLEARVSEKTKELRVAEEELRQSQKLEAVGRLAGGIAHDFNNMLAVIMGYADMLQAGLPTADPRRSDLEEIAKAAGRASSLTKQLLAFGRRQVLAPVPLDVPAVLSDQGQVLRRLLGEDVQVTLHAAPDTPPIFADPVQMQQVLMNLAINARDAMPMGGKLGIYAERVDVDTAIGGFPERVPAGTWVTFTVSDTGTGIDPEHLPRIFEPFFTTKELGKGTGLGLATVFGIVKQSNGYIQVESSPRRGATFHVFLPPSSEHALPGPRPVRGGHDAQGHETILVVEDDEQVCELATSMLRRSGYRVLRAAGPGDALLMAEQHGDPIDLLLTDVVMPHMRGDVLARRLVASRPGLRVLFMSGYMANADLEVGGMTAAFIEKPFKAADLLPRVRQALDAAPAGEPPTLVR